MKYASVNLQACSHKGPKARLQSHCHGAPSYHVAFGQFRSGFVARGQAAVRKKLVHHSDSSVLIGSPQDSEVFEPSDLSHRRLYNHDSTWLR